MIEQLAGAGPGDDEAGAELIWRVNRAIATT